MQPTQPTPNHFERRRHIRMPTSFPVRILTIDQSGFAGMVKDYCPGGVFVEFDAANQQAFQAWVSTVAAPGVAVQFQTPDGPLSEIPTRVARLQGSGVGLAFDNANPANLQLMGQVATIAARALAPQTDPSALPAGVAGVAGADLTAESAAAVGNRLDLARTMEDLVENFLNPRMGSLFEKAEEILFAAARDASNNSEQQACFEAIDELQNIRNQVTAAFVEEIIGQIRGLGEGRVPVLEDADGKDEGLALVDTGSFDDWLTVKSIIDRGEKKVGREEDQLARRVSAAMGLNLDADANPFGMRAMCFAFHDALQNLAASKRARSAVFSGFEDQVVTKLGTLQEEFAPMLPQSVPEAASAAPAAQQAPAASAADVSGSSAEDPWASGDQHASTGAVQPAPGTDSIELPIPGSSPAAGSPGAAGPAPVHGGAPAWDPNQSGMWAQPVQPAPAPQQAPVSPGGSQGVQPGWDPNQSGMWAQPVPPAASPAPYAGSAGQAAPPGWDPNQSGIWAEPAPTVHGVQAPQGGQPLPAGSPAFNPFTSEGQASAPATGNAGLGAPAAGGTTAFHGPAPAPRGQVAGGAPPVVPGPGGFFDPNATAAAQSQVGQVRTAGPAGQDAAMGTVAGGDVGGMPAPAGPLSAGVGGQWVVPAPVRRSVQMGGQGAGGAQRVAGAWQAARNLMALRRQLVQHEEPVGILESTGEVETAPQALSSDLIDRLRSPQLAEQIKSAVSSGSFDLAKRVRQMAGANAAALNAGTTAGDALEVVSALLEAVLGDVLIRDESKERIGQLAVPLLRTAFSEESFLSSPHHPAREVVDRIGRLDLQHGPGHDGEAGGMAQAVDGLVQQILGRYVEDPRVFDEVLPELDQLLDRQKSQYEDNLKGLVEAKEKQEALVASLRKSKGEPETGHRTGMVESLPDEWRAQLMLAQHMPIGQVVTLEPGTARQQSASLAWRAADHSQFLFADMRGNKAASFSLQELAMGLRRGTVVVADDADLGPVERGVYRMLQDMHKDLAHESTHDKLTGLQNAKSYRDGMDGIVRRVRQESTCAVVCNLELDRFSRVAERCGPAASDKLLVQVARLLEKHLGDRGQVAHLGQARFGVLLESAVPMEIEPLLERLCRAVKSSRCVYGGESIDLSISIVFAGITEDAPPAGQIIDSLATACLTLVDEGGNSVKQINVETSDDEAGADLDGVTLAGLLAEDRLVLRGQLVKPMSEDDDRKPYYEVLLGYRDDNGQLQSAGPLFADADETTSLEVDQWVVTNSLDWMKSNRRAVAKLSGLSINLSPAVLAESKMLDFVVEEFTRSDVPPGKVMFEVKESTATEQLTVAQEFMRSLREFGCRFSLDDFRAGQASFAYLKNLPVDRVKIGGALVQDMVVGDQECAMVRSVNEIAHFMGKETIAELVDDKAILEKLVELGVDHAQGFCIQHPLALDELAERINSGTAF